MAPLEPGRLDGWVVAATDSTNNETGTPHTQTYDIVQILLYSIHAHETHSRNEKTMIQRGSCVFGSKKKGDELGIVRGWGSARSGPQREGEWNHIGGWLEKEKRQPHTFINAIHPAFLLHRVGRILLVLIGPYASCVPASDNRRSSVCCLHNPQQPTWQ